MDKIRDLRGNFFRVDDEYLNGYAKLCGINATGVYLSMCRHANKQQQCFPSKKLISEELAISERSVYSAIKKLEEWEIIKVEYQGRKENGSFKNLLYTLLNKTDWRKKPSANCAVGKKRHSPSATGAVDRRQQVPNKETHTTKHIKPNTSLSATADEVYNSMNQSVKKNKLPSLVKPEKKDEKFDYALYLDKMEKNKNRNIKIIRIFFIVKQRSYVNLEQVEGAIQRNLSAAKSLAGYSDQRIKETMEWLNGKFSDDEKRWTLETVGKYIDDLKSRSKIVSF